jgi:hypothetical protein
MGPAAVEGSGHRVPAPWRPRPRSGGRTRHPRVLRLRPDAHDHCRMGDRPAGVGPVGCACVQPGGRTGLGLRARGLPPFGSPAGRSSRTGWPFSTPIGRGGSRSCSCMERCRAPRAGRRW